MFAFKRFRMFVSEVVQAGTEVILYIFKVTLASLNMVFMTHASYPLNHRSSIVTSKTSRKRIYAIYS